MSRFEDALARFRRRSIGAEEAGELLGVSGRVRATIRVHAYPDGHLALFDGPRCLARYPADASLITEPVQEAA